MTVLFCGTRNIVGRFCCPPDLRGRAALLLAALLLAACATPAPPTDQVRLCTGDGCATVPATTATVEPAPVPPPSPPAEADRQFRLAERYRTGDGVERSTDQWLRLLRAAADQGQPEAAFDLGTALLQGRQLPRDRAAGAGYLGVAAAAGLGPAQYDLGLLHLRGEGVPQDGFQALRWLRLAGENGERAAQALLGRLYLHGYDLMGPDPQEADRWLTAAAGQGDRRSAELLAELPALRARQAQQRHEQALARAETRRLILELALLERRQRPWPGPPPGWRPSW